MRQLVVTLLLSLQVCCVARSQDTSLEAYASRLSISPCRAGSSELARLVKEVLTPIAIGADSVAARNRQRYDLLQVDTPEKVEYVTDSDVCGAVADALGSYRRPPGDRRDYPEGLWVLAVGAERYVVFHENLWAAGSLQLLVFDANLKGLGNIPF